MLLSEALRLRILELMKKNKINNSHELSLIAGISYSTLNDFFRNRTSSVGISKLVHICDALNINLSDFFNSNLFNNIECDDDIK